MNNRKGDGDAAILLVFVIPVVLIFGIRSCAMKADVSADQSASQRSLDQIEQEIKNFLVESKSISIQLNGQL